ncbi:hypothetical protein D9758_014752 [Tetrapyrgos nigripes]|uniref:Mid2 domain-containing protein n=1 Tax=Tetrapyrgos nigripes TaxID=182062 RepID=A0A8H5FLW8_9AGAR|nr:hypothetical protein D9758_014752 [Tetrapyrgos nigripes]
MHRVDDYDNFTEDTSEPLTITDADSSSGDVTIFFTVSPGAFRLLAINEDHPLQKPFLMTGPTITAVSKDFESPRSTASRVFPQNTIDNISPADTQTSSSLDTYSTSSSIDTTTTATSSPTPSPMPSSGQPANAQPSDQQPSNSQQSSSSKVPIIVGGVLGGIVFILLLLIFGWVMRRRRRRRTASLHSVIFHRDMMVRQRDYDNLGMGMGSAEGPVGGTQKLEDSRVFRFEGVSTGIGRDGGKPSVRTSPISNYSESVAREDEGKGVHGFRQ